MSEFSGKALYKPKGRSGEYSQWAINFYNGCTGRCKYCYNKRFPILSGLTPQLKTCFKDKTEAFEIAKKEIASHKKEIIKDGGVFLSFVSDPCLPDTFMLTAAVISYCSGIMQSLLAEHDKSVGNEPIPVIILTKRADWVLNESAFLKPLDNAIVNTPFAKDIAFGFTLTGHDEMEPGCSTNADRIKAMKILHDKGFRTWASIEPIIDFRSSLEMIRACAPFCDHFKVGLRTDKKFECSTDEFVNFVNGIRETVNRTGSTVYFKRSIRDLVGGGYIIGKNFVMEGYNMFTKNHISSE